MPVSSPPEQGQLVSVRQRRYVVTEVAKSTLPEALVSIRVNPVNDYRQFRREDMEKFLSKVETHSATREKGNG